MTTTKTTPKTKKSLIPENTEVSTAQPKPLSESLKRIGDLAKDWEEGPRMNTKETHAEPRLDTTTTTPTTTKKSDPTTTTTTPTTQSNWALWATITGIISILLTGTLGGGLYLQMKQNQALTQTIERMNENILLIQDKVETLQTPQPAPTEANDPGRVGF